MNRILPSVTLFLLVLAIIPQAGAAAAELTAPVGLAATATSGSEIALSWEDSNSRRVKSMSIVRSLSPSSGFVEIAQLSPNVRVYLDMGLAFSTTYYYKVQALGTKNRQPSPYSAVAGATTMAGAGDNTPPTVPQNVTARGTSCMTTNVEWSPSTDAEAGVAGYRVFRDGQFIATTGFYYYYDLNAEGATSYSYQVEAYDANANFSGRSSSATMTTLPCPDFTPPTEPGWISAQDMNCTDVSISWGASTDSGSGVAAYQVMLFGGTVALLDGNQTSFVDSASYYEGFTLPYTVRAIDAHGNPSTEAGPATVTMPLCNVGGNQAPVANAGPDQTSDPGVMVFVNGGQSVDPDGSIESYHWDFGDGFTGTGRFTGHIYENAGQYTITLTVTDNQGATDTDTAILDVVALTNAHDWSTNFGGPDTGDAAVSESIATDANGDVVVVGSLSHTADLGGGPLTSSGLNDAFVVKYSSSGAHQWTQLIGSTSNELALAVAIDAGGNILVAGSFNGTFDAGTGPVTSNGSDDFFLAKLSPSGVPMWVISHGNSGSDRVRSIAVDRDDNIIVAGTHIGALDVGGNTLTAAGSFDVFLAKYSPSGAHIWSLSLGGTNVDDVTGVATDNGGNILIAGAFRGSARFGGQQFTSAGINDAYLAKFSPEGQHLWSQTFGGSGNDIARALAVDIDGSVLLTGYFGGAVNFGGGFLPDTGGVEDLFLALYSSSGNHIWSRSFGSGASTGAVPSAVAIDDQGNFALTGSIVANISLGGDTLGGTGSTDVFVASYSSSGEHLWSDRFGGSNSDRGKAVSCDANGGIFVAGTFYYNVDLGGGTLQSPGGLDTFLARFQP